MSKGPYQWLINTKYESVLTEALAVFYLCTCETLLSHRCLKTYNEIFSLGIKSESILTEALAVLNICTSKTCKTMLNHRCLKTSSALQALG